MVPIRRRRQKRWRANSGVGVKSLLSLSLLLAILCSRCRPTGIIGLDDNRFFSERPVIVIQNDRYFVRFRYADREPSPFYMKSTSRIREGKLIIFIPVTTSTGKAGAMLQMDEIHDQDKITLIKQGHVYWEHRRRLTRMHIETL